MGGLGAALVSWRAGAACHPPFPWGGFTCSSCGAHQGFTREGQHEGMNSFEPYESAGGAGHVRPSWWWTVHFRRNRHREWNIPWDDAALLDAAARGRIAWSIAEFQRGESSEARCYLALSEAFCARTGDPEFHHTSLLFVHEENEHAALLGRFMRLAGIPEIGGSWGDRVFRRLRSLGDIGWASRVLMIAELIAQEYYPALRETTGHPVLRRICDKIIADEEAHIRFQVERIVRVEASKSWLAVFVRRVAQTVLMAGAAAVVLAGHRRVLGRHPGAWAFLTHVMARNRRALDRIDLLRRGGHAAHGISAQRPLPV